MIYTHVLNRKRKGALSASQTAGKLGSTECVIHRFMPLVHVTVRSQKTTEGI